MLVFRGGDVGGGCGGVGGARQLDAHVSVAGTMFLQLMLVRRCERAGVAGVEGKSQLVGSSNVVCFALKLSYHSGEVTLRLETRRTLPKL